MEHLEALKRAKAILDEIVMSRCAGFQPWAHISHTDFAYLSKAEQQASRDEAMDHDFGNRARSRCADPVRVLPDQQLCLARQRETGKPGRGGRGATHRRDCPRDAPQQVGARCLIRVDGSGVIRFVPVKVGQRRLLGLGAGTTASLPAMPLGDVEELTRTVAPGLRNHPRVSRQSLRVAVAQVRKTGFAMSQGSLSSAPPCIDNRGARVGAH